jgi:hypothetical protein
MQLPAPSNKANIVVFRTVGKMDVYMLTDFHEGDRVNTVACAGAANLGSL